MARSTKEGPASHLKRFVVDLVGPVTRFEERTVPYGEARVWAVWQDDAIVAWLKRHRHKDKALRERHAYEHWVPKLGRGTTRLLGVCAEAPAALLIDHVHGTPADLAPLDDEGVRALYRALGEFLSRLHGLDIPDDDTMPMEEALDARCAGWLARAADVIDIELVDEIERMFADPWPSGLVRVPCHRDLQWHNVLVRGTGDDLEITVIDFGQSRPDVRFADFVKLFQLPDELVRGASTAFFEGYGRRLSGDEIDALVRLRALHGLATWVTADDRNDQRGCTLGRKVLNEALDAWRG